MYLIKNAMANIKRNKGRNILTSCVLVLMIFVLSTGIIINETSSSIIEDYKNRFGAEVFIDIDFDKLMSGNGDFDFTPISAEQYEAFAESEYLKHYAMQASLGIIPKDLTSIDEVENNPNMGNVGMVGPSGSELPDDIIILDMPTANLLASNHPNISADFESGKRTITSGKLPSAKNEVMISEQYAKLNKLKVGDSVVVNTTDPKSKASLTLTITGIFEDLTMVGVDNMMMLPMSNTENDFITTMDTITEFEGFGVTGGMINYTYTLKDPSMLEAFTKEVESKGLPSIYKVSTDEASYNQIVGPVVGLTNITQTFLLTILLLGCGVLVVLSINAVRERKYEIGVLRAMGMKRGAVITGFMAEMLAITGLCLVVGLGAGIIAAQPISDALLQQQIDISQNTQNDMMGQGGIVVGGSVSGGSMNMNPVESLSEIDVRLTIDMILQIVGISLLLSLVASSAGVIYITKHKPMQILAERN
ncbi:MAG: ABC transporter permease [Erysipelotrichaceae bacterium]